MLKQPERPKDVLEGGRFVIVASEYNREFVDPMVLAAEAEFQEGKAQEVRIVRVPGAFEIPVAAARLARIITRPYDGIVCLGVILRGETTHAQFIGEAVTTALMRLSVKTEVPVVHEVLLLENKEQARVRCLGEEHNLGREAAMTALAMARVMRALRETAV
jgi:6,7-dimethyl-8-ribityllumazine synthase